MTNKNNLLIYLLFISFLVLLFSYTGNKKAFCHNTFINEDRNVNYTSGEGSMENFEFTSDTAVLITDITGNLEVLPYEGKDWIIAKTGDTISFKDKVKTDSSGKGKLVFSDGSIVKLSPDTLIEFQKENNDKIQIILPEGNLWGNIKGELEIVTETGLSIVKNAECAINFEKDSKSSLLTVFRGTVEFSNKLGSREITENQEIKILLNEGPGELKSLSEEETIEKLKWTDFGNPRVMVVIEELNLDQVNSFSSTESRINSELSSAHYHLIDPEEIDLIRKSDEAKNALSGDVLSAATLGMRLKSDIIITGTVETEFVGQMDTSQNSIITCQARCDIRVIIADTAQIILAKKLTEKATSLSKEAAGMKAIDEMAKKIAGELIWEIPVNYTVVSNSHRSVQLVITDCDFNSRSKIIEYLKSIPVINERVYPRSYENSIAILDVEYIGTSEALAEEILKTENPALEITGITMNRIDLKVVK